MENFKDILASFKDRFTNPLIFSFICSWLIINWQISTALFSFDRKQIEIEGYQTLSQFIKAKLNTTDAFWHPLLIAIGYTLLIPILKNLIRAFYSWTSK